MTDVVQLQEEQTTEFFCNFVSAESERISETKQRIFAEELNNLFLIYLFFPKSKVNEYWIEFIKKRLR